MNAVKSLGILFLVFLVPAGVAMAADGSLYLSPSSGSYFVGQTFDEQLLVDTDGTLINAAEAEISFDPSAVEVDHISTAGSIIGSWPTEPTFSNATGSIQFTGWMTNTYTGSGGLLITITFKALRDTASSAQLKAGAILAAGGDESNIITSMRSATFSVQPQEVVPPAPPSAANAAPTPAPAAAPGSNNTPEIYDALSGGITPVEQSDASGSAPAPAQSASAPAQPVFTDYQGVINAGEQIVVKGTAAPSSTVYVWLQKNDESPVRSSVQADAQGSFTYVSDTAVEAGTYHVWAQSESGGNQSLLSNTIVITAQQLGLAASVAAAADLAGSVYAYFAVLILGSLGAGYLFHRHKIEKLKYVKGE